MSDTIINPASRRGVSRTGAIGRSIVAATALINLGTDLGKLHRAKCPGGGAWDPAAGKCVTAKDKDGGRYHALMALAAAGNRNRLAAANAAGRNVHRTLADEKAAWESEYARMLAEIHAQRTSLRAERAALNRDRRDFEERVRLWEMHHGDD